MILHVMDNAQKEKYCVMENALLKKKRMAFYGLSVNMMNAKKEKSCVENNAILKMKMYCM